MKNTLQEFRLDNRVAVITGGAGLLGRKHAETIIEAGGEVVILDINEKALTEAKNYFLEEYKKEILALNVDITDEKQLLKAKENIFKHFKKYPEILINNAAIDPKMEKEDKKDLSRLENFKLEQWNLEIAVGLTGALLCSRIFGAEMVKMKKGVILNISSDLGIIAPDQRLYRKEGVPEDQQPVKPVTYSVIKHGMIGLTRYLATYWADKGVRTNAVCFGGIYNNQPDDFVKKLIGLIPMRRMAKKDEYKATVLYMISDASSFMNGAIVSVDGGRTCG
jgi:NAD(P)-dependent dehydrogenase (short-subunit alcohol dehydrogenase family)